MSRNKHRSINSPKKGFPLLHATCFQISSLIFHVNWQHKNMEDSNVSGSGDRPLVPILSEGELEMAEPAGTSRRLAHSGTRHLIFREACSLVISIRGLASVTRRDVQQRYFQNSVKHFWLNGNFRGKRNSLFNVLLFKYII